ncbi:GMP synthase (glutamine-hydrolyzing), partial [Legionella pneumophila]
MNDLKKSPLLILDFGSQYTQLIARRVREIGVYCEIYPYNINHEQFKKLNPCGVILSGGPSTVTHDANPRAPQWLFESDLPLLGICYGMQTMAVQLGGQVHSSTLREFGYAELRLHGHSQLLSNIEDRTAMDGSALLDVWMSHGDKVTELPPGF